jgi:hypothetical protein
VADVLKAISDNISLELFRIVALTKTDAHKQNKAYSEAILFKNV